MTNFFTEEFQEVPTLRYRVSSVKEWANFVKKGVPPLWLRIVKQEKNSLPVFVY
jgi:hypothetical protein